MIQTKHHNHNNSHSSSSHNPNSPIFPYPDPETQHECWRQALVILRALNAAQARFKTWPTLILAVHQFKTRVLEERSRTSVYMQDLHSYLNEIQSKSGGNENVLKHLQMTSAKIVNGLLDERLINEHTLTVIQTLVQTKTEIPSFQHLKVAIQKELERIN